MPCFYCGNGVWICDPDALGPHICDDVANANPTWHYVGDFTINADGIHKVWCRRGGGGPCDAKVQEPSPGAQWSLAGAIKFVAGDYELYCSPGGAGGDCQVKIEEK